VVPHDPVEFAVTDEPALVADDERFWSLVPRDARLEQLATGAIWAEGPVYLPASGDVVWSDIPNDRMLRWSPSGDGRVFRSPSNFVNGNTLDADGRIVHCSHGARALLRTEHDGTVTTLVDRWHGRRLNSPNDLVVRADGTIWFTDPPYGIRSNREGYQADSEIRACNVYRLDPDGWLDVGDHDVEEPNGLALSPDGSLLYVADTSAAFREDGGGNHHIRVYDVLDDRRACNGRLFAEVTPGLADGFRLDLDGNLYTSSADSIQVYEPAGRRLGKIRVPEKVSNCCWGGPGHNELYITASSSLYRIVLTARGHGLLW
jgi:gluconolactonase